MLNRLIWSILGINPELSAKEILLAIEADIEVDDPKYDIDRVVIEVDGWSIIWLDQRGKERTTKRKTFENRVSELKRKLREL